MRIFIERNASVKRIIQKETYLLELTRYVAESQWLDVDWTLSQFGKDRTQAILAYRQFVMEGKGLSDPKEQVLYQIFLGNETFNTEKILSIEKPETLREVSKAHKRAIKDPLP